MRHENWQTRLTDIIHSREQEPFDFPTFNCLTLAMDGIEAVTGEDYFKAYRGKYKTETQAKRLLKNVDNVKTSQELIVLKLGNPALQPVAFARLGDIVFIDEASEELGDVADVKLFGPIPGICYGANSYFVGEHGLVQLSTLRLSSAIWVS